MSVLIKDMKMPENCKECPFAWRNNVAGRIELIVCELTDGYKAAFIDGRMESCPIIEQKTGKWIDKWYCSNMSGYEYAMKCSECGKPTYRISLVEPMPNYCPNCGAKMESEE